MAARPKEWVCGRLLAGIVYSNPAGGGEWIFVSCECRVLSGRGHCVGQRSLTDCGASECDRH